MLENHVYNKKKRGNKSHVFLRKRLHHRGLSSPSGTRGEEPSSASHARAAAESAVRAHLTLVDAKKQGVVYFQDAPDIALDVESGLMLG